MAKKSINPDEMMQECVQLALMGKGYTVTNPVVGACVVKDGEVIGRGFHEGFGGPHAEVNAIQSAEGSVEGADLYVTLEPCSHKGKTPPCTDLIIKSGIKRVFVGVVDPNPVNAGRGIDILNDAGIEVYPGFAEDACASIIEDFTKYIIHKKPYYTLKLAQSLDGKTATYTGDSKWITSASSRVYVHYLRSISDAVLIGVQTLIDDDAKLTVRDIPCDREPKKIILDPDGRMPETCTMLKDSPQDIIYVTKSENSKSLLCSIKGAEVLYIPHDGQGFDLEMLSEKLIEMNILNVLIEGGGHTAGTFFDNNLIDRANFFTAPKVIGGKDASTLGGKGAKLVKNAPEMKDVQVRRFEDDVLITGKFNDYTAHVKELTEKIRNRCARKCSRG